MDEDQIEWLIEERIKIAATTIKSDDEVVKIAWLVDGLDLWHQTNGKRGHSPAETRRYVISRVTRLLEANQPFSDPTNEHMTHGSRG